MDAMTFLGFVATVVIGFAIMALLLEFLNPERRPAVREEAKRIPDVVRTAGSSPIAVAGFFARPLSTHLPSATIAFDDGLFAQLQHHVKTEHAMVAEFVHLPSIDSLYRQARTPLTMH
jgi:hypothetical protein